MAVLVGYFNRSWCRHGAGDTLISFYHKPSSKTLRHHGKNVSQLREGQPQQRTIYAHLSGVDDQSECCKPTRFLA